MKQGVSRSGTRINSSRARTATQRREDMVVADADEAIDGVLGAQTLKLDKYAGRNGKLVKIGADVAADVEGVMSFGCDEQSDEPCRPDESEEAMS